MRLICDCLNIKIHIRGDALQSSVNPETLLTDEEKSDEFFKQKFSKEQLDIEGIQQAYACLVAHRVVGNWIVGQCMNCKLNTHAVNKTKGGNEILINMNLKTGSTVIQQLKKDEEFSALYKIIIRNHDRDEQVSQRKFESSTSDLEKLQQMLNSFLINEEREMENRIKEFTERQYAEYAELQDKVRKEKDTLIRLVLTGNEGTLEKSADHEEPNLNREMKYEADQEVPKSPPQKITSKVLQVKIPVRKTSEQSSPDNEDMFMLDFEDNTSPMHYTESDDEHETSDDDSMTSGSSKDVPVRSIYSSSVPVNVPDWSVRSFRGDPESEVNDDMPNDIAASIKALAQSVREDGTEIFGDLPKRKMTRVKFTEEKFEARSLYTKY